MGLGESQQDRFDLLIQLASLNPHPESVPINRLVPIPGTPLAEEQQVEALDFVATIAVARIMMPDSYVRLSAGRESMSDETQTLCFMAGANSIFCGETLLTVPNAEKEKDKVLLERLGIQFEKSKKSENEFVSA